MALAIRNCVLLTSAVPGDGRVDIEFHGRQSRLDDLTRQLKDQTKTNIGRQFSGDSTQEAAVSPLSLNIVIQVVGSRGDIQPFVALGKSLKADGHRVRLATHIAFRNLVTSNGLEFFNIGGDPEALMAFMVKNPGLLPNMNTLRSGAVGRRRREMKAIFTGCWRSCFEMGDGTSIHQISDDLWDDELDYRKRPFVADAIIANPPTFVHLSCAERLGIPLNIMFT